MNNTKPYTKNISRCHIVCRALFIIHLLALNVFALGGEQIEREQYFVDSAHVSMMIEKADEYARTGEYVKARKLYKEILFAPDVERFSREAVEKKLEDTSLKIIFSRTITKNSTLYTIKSGDSLHKIAKKFGTTIELIKKSNNLFGNKKG